MTEGQQKFVAILRALPVKYRENAIFNLSNGFEPLNSSENAYIFKKDNKL